MKMKFVFQGGKKIYIITTNKGEWQAVDLKKKYRVTSQDSELTVSYNVSKGGVAPSQDELLSIAFKALELQKTVAAR